MARRYATPPGLSSRRAAKSCRIDGTGDDMALRFGVFDHIEPVPGRRLDQIYRERLVQIERLGRAGFYAYPLAEHHWRPLHLFRARAGVPAAAAATVPAALVHA